MKKLLALSLGDAKNISRDPLLLLPILAPILLSIVLRYGLPILGEALDSQFALDLSPHYNFIRSFFLLLTPLIIGAMAGFLLLDDRDEGTLAYFAVTPLSKSGYLYYRVAFPTLLSLLFTISGGIWIFEGTLSLGSLILIAIMASLEAPMLGLFLGVFAANKVEGLALSKALGLLFFGPIVGYLVQSPWQIAAGVMPSYWVSKAFIANQDFTRGTMYITVGFAVHTVYIWALLRKFARRIE